MQFAQKLCAKCFAINALHQMFVLNILQQASSIEFKTQGLAFMQWKFEKENCPLRH